MSLNVRYLWGGLLVFTLLVAGCFSLRKEVSPNLVYFCTFDSTADVLRPKIGLAGKLRNPEFREIDGRKAMYVPVGAGVVDVELPRGLPQNRGCIEFDAKILATKPYFINGGDPRFFEICAPHLSGWNIIALCDFNGNNGIGNSGLYTQIGEAVMTSQNGKVGCFPYASVPGMFDYKAWHHYTISWNVEGIAQSSNLAEVRIDGLLVTSYPIRDVELFRKRMSQPSVMHFANAFDTKGVGNAKTPFLLDNFKIWTVDAPEKE